MQRYSHDPAVAGRRNRRSPSGARSILLVAVALCLAIPARAEVVNRILATVDGDPVTLYELKQFAEKDVRLREGANVDPAVILNALITKRLIDKEVQAKGLVVEEEDVDRYIAGIRDQNRLTDEQLAAAVEQQGMTMEAYRAQVRDELLRAQLINREIRGKVSITPEDLERYYEAAGEQPRSDAQIAVSHIVLRLPPDASQADVDAAMERARKIHSDLQSGADFADMARQVSEDAAAENGGRLGSFNQGELLEPLEKAVASLEPGKFSQPVRSPLGVHIVRLDERASSESEKLDAQEEEIRERLYNAALEERYNRWLTEDLRERHHVEIRP